jgi:hypothetical protein
MLYAQNKADAGIVIHRYGQDMQEALGLDPRATVIIVEKMRNRAAGTKGVHMMLYDRSTGLYDDPDGEKVQAFQEAWVNNKGKRKGGKARAEGRPALRS